MEHPNSAIEPHGEAGTLESRDVVPGISKPKLLFLLAAALSFLMSVYLFFTGDAQRGIYVGLWVPSILAGGALLLAGTHDER